MALIGILILNSCEESVQGCLDLRAGNYDVRAVSSCEDCCVYPIISLDVDFVDQDTVSFSFGTKYELGDDSISITDFFLAFSEFEFYENGTQYQALDSLPEMPELKDDYLFIEDNSSRKSIGESKFLITLDSVSMRIGYDIASIRRLGDPSTITDDTKLSTMLGRLYVDTTETYLQAKMSLEIGDSLRLLDFQEIPKPRLGFPEMQELSVGEAWSVELKMNMLKLLEGIKAADTNEELQDKISNNISAATFR